VKNEAFWQQNGLFATVRMNFFLRFFSFWEFFSFQVFALQGKAWLRLLKKIAPKNLP